MFKDVWRWAGAYRTTERNITRSVGRPAFTWGSGRNLQGVSPDRGAYLSALRHADANPDDVTALAAFARS